MMEDTKGLFFSKTFWGAALAIAASVAHMMGYNLGDAQGFADDLVVMLGGALAVYGRITAVKKIG